MWHRSTVTVLLAINPYFYYIGNMEENDVIRSLAALAHSLRLQVFRMLVVAGPTGMTPGAIAEQLDVPGATLSFHLKELMNAHLVTQERDGRNLIYRAAYDHMDALLGFLTANCCQGEACLEADTTACKC
ncbi:ArsR family transcriptional regulator [Ralstonia sp. GP73]|jgi:ArsR family transcriptional regulator|uniref:HTH arsR-type domain-containing protein n=7 Tax=Ralstonia TaxID=48736 RepID=A0ABM9KXH2_9RALS|nr:hypothetical protein HMPREF0989_04885 [Ralstonia sp. 5_2_56FAA]MDH6644177.1 ArsR family transcriptional regulator [Ralstonia sp. GP73]CAJ0683032.1 hypothetical protein R77591_02143 [Ralstonia mannitolilytica]CAJ0726345.1 hypothetical protein R38712_03013 [Ralstonia pickettii]CAJ0888825.1 hypothetical protein R77564_03321 [Ralstonia sp. LMG 32965]